MPAGRAQQPAPSGTLSTDGGKPSGRDADRYSCSAFFDLSRWFKVKAKTADSTGASGLVPASYLATPTHLKAVTVLYSYAPSRNEAGELDNEEELEVEEGETLLLWEEEGDWVLVGREGGRGVGFVPASYIEVSEQYATCIGPS